MHKKSSSCFTKSNHKKFHKTFTDFLHESTDWDRKKSATAYLFIYLLLTSIGGAVVHDLKNPL